jgi:hypothetical protein
VQLPDDLIPLSEFASMSHKSPNAIYSLKYRDAGPTAYSIGGRLWFSKAEVERWILEGADTKVTCPTCGVTSSAARRAEARAAVSHTGTEHSTERAGALRSRQRVPV